MSACGGLCCKSIFGIWSRNIDSRSDTNEQQRFKRTDAPIRLLQISISQSLLGDFCNTIGTKRTYRGKRSLVRFWSEADIRRRRASTSSVEFDPKRTSVALAQRTYKPVPQQTRRGCGD